MANYRLEKLQKAKWLTHLTSEAQFTVLEQMQQAAISQHQQKLIKQDNVVVMLSAFPFFLLEYLGAEKIQSLLG